MMKIVTSDKLLLSLSEFENERYYFNLSWECSEL